jgi:hypothetical protein
MERIKVGRRVVKASKVSSIQWLLYYRSVFTKQEYSAAVFQRTGGLEVVGIDDRFPNLQECAVAILSNISFQ